MCGRYIVVSKIEKIEQRFNVKANNPEQFEINYNISAGNFAPIITSESPKLLQFYRFGLTPFWAKKPMYLINARSEGDFNKENDILYNGKLGLRDKPSFRKPFRSQRCLVPADAFIEGTTKEKLNKPFVVFPSQPDFRPFSFAGIYDHWVDKKSGEVISSFSIITTVSTSLLRLIPHHRSPVVLQDRDEEAMWLDNSSNIADLENLLRPFNDERFNAYPISNKIKNPAINDRSLIEPIGERLLKTYDYQLSQDIELVGMGMTQARKRDNSK